MDATQSFEHIFPKRLKMVRRERNVTQEALAEGLHVSKGAVGMWETGKRTPTLKKLNEIAEFLDCRLDYLVGKSEDLLSPKSVSDAVLEADQRTEREFIAIYKAAVFEAFLREYASLDVFGRTAVDAVLHAETKRCEKTGCLGTTEWLTAEIRVDVSHIPTQSQEEYLKDRLSFVPAPLVNMREKALKE